MKIRVDYEADTQTTMVWALDKKAAAVVNVRFDHFKKWYTDFYGDEVVGFQTKSEAVVYAKKRLKTHVSYGV